MPIKPWESIPALSEEKIRYVSALIRKGQDSAVESFAFDQGDNNWTLGCVAYRRSCYQIEQAAEFEAANWLGVLSPGMEFIFSVGGVAARLFHGDPEGPESRRLKQTVIETRQFELQFPDEEKPKALMWRFVNVTNGLGYTEFVSCVGYDADERIHARHDVSAGEMPVVFRRSVETNEFADSEEPPEVQIREFPSSKVKDEGESE